LQALGDFLMVPRAHALGFMLAPASPVEQIFKAARLRDFGLEIMPNNQITGNIGLYYVCNKLSRMGLNVMPTARNARGIDIIAYGKTGRHFVGIQVKALSGRNAVPLGRDAEALMGDFWVIVNNLGVETKAFIMTLDEVKERAQVRGSERVSVWLQKKDYEKDEFKDRWDRIEKKIKTET